jgi:5-enolpyruvylshikimate-3-phosphate synthase
MTARMMQAFQSSPGPAVERSGEHSFRVLQNPYARSTADFAIEPDATAASYFAALPLVVGGSNNLGLNCFVIFNLCIIKIKFIFITISIMFSKYFF